MNIIDIINKKRLKQELTREEMEYAFNGYLNKDVKDYQMSSLLMAICINGMTDPEIFALTDIFLKSGDRLDLTMIPGIKIDKHSTGGVGDKVTLIIGPIVSSLGVPVPKMSGRGLGHTGGTIDKLESIKGFNVNLTEEEFIKQIQEIGFAVTAQTKNLCPMDKVIYALRDVTGTVSSIPLIASSIMSKKLAGGADKILLDVKCGNGALMQNKEDAERLADIMTRIGKYYDREVKCEITDMNSPLGDNIGNSLEVIEAMEVLKGIGPNDITEVCIQLAANIVSSGLEIEYDYFEEFKRILNQKNESMEAELRDTKEALQNLNEEKKIPTRIFSEEAKKKMSESHYDCSGSKNPRARKVKCIETG